MNNLSILTDEELIKYSEELTESEYQDNQMDGSGDCGSMISKHYEPLHEALAIEFEKRNISTPDYYLDMPI